jgi:hypothetical protein
MNLSSLLTPRYLAIAAIDVPAGVLDVAAQLVPLVRAHTAAIGFAGPAHIALWHRAGGALRRFWSGTWNLDQRPKLQFLLERTRHRHVRSNNHQQIAANSNIGLHAWLSGNGLVAMDAY